MDPIRCEADLDDALRSTRLAAVVVAWAAGGLFDELVEGPKTLEQLSGDRRSLRVTARILAHAGLLVRHGDTWALSSTAARLHREGALKGYRDLEFFRQLGRLDELLEEGGPVFGSDDEDADGTSIGARRDDFEQTRKFQEMLYRRSATSARATAAWIDREIGETASVLDLGGGHGRYGMELAERGHDVTLFDLPVSVDAARSMHGERLDYIEGDFFEDDVGGPYDAVLASNIIHGLSPDQNQTLVRRISDAVGPGGIFVVKDMFLDEFEIGPPRAVFFGLQMLMYTEEGDSYSLDQMHQWFEEAGLEPEAPVVFESFVLAVGRNPA